jgi:Glycosyl hydrolase catalytic core
MRSRLLCLVIAALSLFALPAAAQAKLTVGIAENNPQMFFDPLFTQLGAKHSRVVVSWNVATARNDEINRVIDYMAGARAAGVTPLVTFEHARGDATICNRRKNRKKAQCKLPTAKQYEKSLRAFKKLFPAVRNVVAWNEINHFTQPTYKNPKAAAKFTTIARKVFKGGTVVVADILDQADNVRAKRPTFRSTTRYIKAFRKAYKGPRSICGIHNYSDTNRFRSTGTKAIIKALGCKQIWLTEAGGLYKFVGYKANQNRQLKATKYMFKVAKANKKIKRAYVYSWFGAPRSARFDSGIVGTDGKPRKAFAEVRKHVK